MKRARHWIGPKIQVPVPKDDLDRLSKFASAAGVSRAEWIRRAIKAQLEREAAW